MSLYDALQALYEKHGYFIETVQSIDLDGIEGKKKISQIMDAFRADHFDAFADAQLVTFNDYKTQVSQNLETGEETALTLPVSNVLKFVFNENSWYALRPSGTEPKIKIYYSATGNTRAEAETKLDILKKAVNNRVPE